MKLESHDEIVFNTFFTKEKKGPIFLTQNQYLNSTIVHYNKLLSGLETSPVLIKKSPKIIFNIISNPILNACAGISNKNLYLIGIYSSTFYIVDDLCRRILSHKENLKHIGSPNKEKISEPTIRNYYDNVNDLIDLGPLDYGEFPNNHPQDEERDIFARLISETIIEFIFHHELAHILNGHLNIKCKTTLDYQTLEMDSDCIATSKLLAKHVRIFKGIIKSPQDYKKYYTNISSVIYFISYSLVLFNRITADYPYLKAKELTDLNHSKPRVRQFQILATILEYFNNYFQDIISPKELLDTFSKATYECEKNCINVTSSKIGKEAYEEAISEDAKLLNREQLENWKVLKPELEKHAFVKLVK